MSATLTVPASFVSYLRNGLFGEWGRAAEDIATVAGNLGGSASDGVYGDLLQTFSTICILLGEVGWKDDDTQSDVIINLGVGSAYVVNGLKDEHRILVQQLEQLPKKTRKAMRTAAASKVAEFGEFVKAVEAKANRLARCPRKSSALLPKHTRPPLQARPSRARRQRH
jgi:hypothetical protein